MGAMESAAELANLNSMLVDDPCHRRSFQIQTSQSINFKSKAQMKDIHTEETEIEVGNFILIETSHLNRILH